MRFSLQHFSLVRSSTAVPTILGVFAPQTFPVASESPEVELSLLLNTSARAPLIWSDPRG